MKITLDEVQVLYKLVDDAQVKGVDSAKMIVKLAGKLKGEEEKIKKIKK